MVWCILLFVLGVGLVTVEFLLPGMICGILGICFLVVSAGIGINHYPEYTLFIIIIEVLGACAGVGFGLWALANTKLGRSLFLDTNQEVEAGYVNIATVNIAEGARGTSLTPLRPSGTIIVDGERYDAVSDGTLIERDSPVIVVEVHGNRVVVEAAPEETASSSAT
jgi:membrane-bound serine protease (ClpP class)